MELKHEALWPIVHTRLREFVVRSDWNFAFIAAGTHSTVPTVISWLANKEPTGERLIRLWHLLAVAGIDSPEIGHLPTFNRLCGELVTFDVVGIDDLQAILEVHNTHPVLAMLRGGVPMKSHHGYQDMLELHQDDLSRAKRALLRQVSLQPADADTPAPLLSTPTPEPTPPATPSMGDDKVLSAAMLLSSILPLARYFNSEDSSSGERSRLRALLGDGGMFELSNHLNALCSERARNDGRK